MAAIRLMKRVGKKATKFQFTATYQSIVLECQQSTWVPHCIAIAWSRRGRRFITTVRPWEPSPDNNLRAALVWPEEETMETVITLYKGPKDKNYETKEWEFAVLDIDEAGKRKVLATHSVNMVRYASSLPIEHELHLMMKPVSRKIKKAILDVSLCSVFLKEGKATDDDMISLASNLSVSNLSTIGFLEDDDEGPVCDEDRPASPMDPSSVLSIDALLKWSQDITQGYHGVSISNMTTSWRNGLAFLAIIHYYKPQLFDYDQLLPNSIKENNKLAFELARSLGISCPLSVNKMLTNTVPDKLAITSFVYQMYSYFTKATPSAIARDATFDLCQELTNNINIPTSPVAFPGSPNHEKHKMYSRHSKSSLNETANGEPVTAVIIAENGEVQPQLKATEDSSNSQINSKPNTATKNSNNGEGLHEKPNTSTSEGTHGSGYVKLIVDTSLQDINDGSKSITPRLEDSGSSKPVINASCLEDGREATMRLKPNTSSPSLLGHSNSVLLRTNISMPSLVGGSTDATLHSNTLPLESEHPEMNSTSLLEGGSGTSSLMGGASLISKVQSSSPADQGTDVIASSKDTTTMVTLADHQRRSPPVGNGIETKSVVPPSNDEAKRLLRKKEVQKLLKQVRNRDGLFNTSKNSCDSDSFESQYAKAARDLIASTLDSSAESTNDSEIRKSDKYTKAKSEPPSNIDTIEAQSLSPNTNVARDYRSPSEVHEHLSTNALEGTMLSLHTNPELLSASVLEPDHTSTAALSELAISKDNDTEQEHPKGLPEIQPVSTKLSKSLGRLIKETERKETERLEAEKKEAEQLKKRLDAEQKETARLLEEKLKATEQVDGVNQATAEDWSQHNEALSQDMLLSQSDYVKCELTKLKIQLQDLECRASSIELDIRDAMSQGDKRLEESLMQEWFGILNRKNKLIKHQISLNILDKEEDLERRQFFVRRELRPLMELLESQKTSEQKAREALLLQQLIDLVDEQDKLERKKMVTQGRGPDDVEPDVSQTTESHPKSTKECIIS